MNNTDYGSVYNIFTAANVRHKRMYDICIANIMNNSDAHNFILENKESNDAEKSGTVPVCMN